MQPDVSLMWKIKEKPFTIMSLWCRKCFNFVFFKEEKNTSRLGQLNRRTFNIITQIHAQV